MRSRIIILLLGFGLFFSCKKDPVVGDAYAYDPTPYQFDIPTNLGWSSFPVPADNPTTVAGVALAQYYLQIIPKVVLLVMPIPLLFLTQIGSA